MIQALGNAAEPKLTAVLDDTEQLVIVTVDEKILRPPPC
jgi:hypothetical protein